MARGRKAVIHYEDEITKVDVQIANCKKAIAELQVKRKALVEAKEKRELRALYETLQNSGYTIREVLELLPNKSA